MLINSSVFMNIHISSGSMENTILTDSYIICNKQVYNNKQPQRLDVVVFRYPLDKNQLYIKRIIGLPGEHIEIKSGKVYIDNNSEPVSEYYLKEEWSVDNGIYSFDVPCDCYLLLGDNRNNSYDNRYWITNDDEKNYIYVNRSDIVAKAWFQYYPQIDVIEQEGINEIFKQKKIVISVLCIIILLISVLSAYKLITNNRNDSSKKTDIKNRIKFLKDDGRTNIYNQIYYIDYLFESFPGTGGNCGESYRMTYTDKNKRYIYFDFENFIKGFKDIIVIKNKYKEELEVSFTSEGIGVFKLEDNTEWRIFTFGDDKIAICHYGVEINDGQVNNITDFEIYMRNGSKYSIKYGDMQEAQYEYKSKRTQLRFKNAIDINEISYIKWNGNKVS